MPTVTAQTWGVAGRGPDAGDGATEGRPGSTPVGRLGRLSATAATRPTAPTTTSATSAARALVRGDRFIVRGFSNEGLGGTGRLRVAATRGRPGIPGRR